MPARTFIGRRGNRQHPRTISTAATRMSRPATDEKVPGRREHEAPFLRMRIRQRVRGAFSESLVYHLRAMQGNANIPILGKPRFSRDLSETRPGIGSRNRTPAGPLRQRFGDGVRRSETVRVRANSYVLADQEHLPSNRLQHNRVRKLTGDEYGVTDRYGRGYSHMADGLYPQAADGEAPKPQACFRARVAGFAHRDQRTGRRAWACRAGA